MKVLNCETDKTIYESLRTITGVSKEELLALFNSIDLERYFEEFPYKYSSADELFIDKLKEVCNQSVFYFDATNWFHLTRTVPTNKFDNGILPLGANLDYIWSLLFSLQEDFLNLDEWNSFRIYIEKESRLDSAFQYQLKYNDKIHWGPYAMLIRDVAFYSKAIGNHDYLDVPEIIEDICYPFSEKYGYDLLENFKEATRPCIVKFQVPKAEEEHLGIVLNYLYHKHHNLEMNYDCNTCFDSKGNPIHNDSIVNIEFL